MAANPRAGQPAQPEDLIDLPHLVTAYYTVDPDPDDVAQQVAFGTSGHRGSSLDGAFNEAHILATTQAIAEIVTRDGRKLRHHTREVRGTATNPMTREDISAKSRALLVPVMGKRRTEALIAAVMNIDTMRDVRQLRRLLQN